MAMHPRLRAPALAVLAALAAGLSFAGPAPAEERFLILQSTTSTQASGLFDAILPRFREETGIEVRVVAVGTGQALENARRGDGDVVLVHAREQEDAFVAAGYGVDRRDVMHNDFVVVGPAADPAGVRGMTDAAAAFRKIAEAKTPFVSRGDDSGTHTKERALWAAAELDPAAGGADWYRETGSGMGATLNTAAAMSAYTLTDRGTWISFRNRRDLELLVEGDPRLYNPYGVILVNPEKHPHVKAQEGRTFIEWITGPEGQAAIAGYRIDGQQLFFPDAQPRP